MLHRHGAACDWGASEGAGPLTTLGGPKGSMVVPMDYDWHLLAGDAAAPPAIHCRLEELPDGIAALVLVQVDDVAERRRPKSAARLDLRWLAAEDDLVNALRTPDLPSGEAFVWCGGEAALMARVCDMLLAERQYPRMQMRASACWKKNRSSFHETLESGLVPEPA